MIVTQATIDAVTELIGECFKMNRHLDRLVSVLGVEFAYNNTADLVHQGIAHYYPMLADSLGEKCLERYNVPVYYAATPEGGQDFATKRGNPVYVTGGGVVEKANFQFNGYGNEIVVNHGYGYETRYAHLNTIEVTEGMKLQRGDRIGTVGATGKSTGSHLHYEVIYRGNRVNPLNYMDLSMPESEYRAMIEKRSAESPRGKMSSTTELLRRNKPAR